MPRLAMDHADYHCYSLFILRSPPAVETSLVIAVLYYGGLAREGGGLASPADPLLPADFSTPAI